MPPRNKKRKPVRPGILIAAEGYVETAFLHVLREYYAVPDYKGRMQTLSATHSLDG